MNERDFFDERPETKRANYSCPHCRERNDYDVRWRPETKRANYSCPHCRERNDYDVRWLRRTKKSQPPRGMNEQQRAQFQKARDYMVRVDDQLTCQRCRKRFDIPNFQTVVFI